MYSVYAIKDSTNIFYFASEWEAENACESMNSYYDERRHEVVPIDVIPTSGSRIMHYLHMFKPDYRWQLPDYLFESERDAETWWRHQNRDAGMPEIVKAWVLPETICSAYESLAAKLDDRGERANG